MRTVIEINNLTKKRIDPNFVKKVVREAAKSSGAVFDLLDISVVFVNAVAMRKINRECRKKNTATDVLSFRLDLGYNKKAIVGKRSRVGGPSAAVFARAGEIILCPDVIAKNARENKVQFSRELSFVLAHGVLHLLGMRHGEKMYGFQDKVVKKLNQK